MATAKKIIVAPVEPEVVSLSLTKREADTLAEILGRIQGIGPQAEDAWKARRALRAAGFGPLYGSSGRMAGTIRVDEGGLGYRARYFAAGQVR